MRPSFKRILQTLIERLEILDQFVGAIFSGINRQEDKRIDMNVHPTTSGSSRLFKRGVLGVFRAN